MKNMIKKKPIGIILLAIFLTWGLINRISGIFLRNDSNSTDVVILNHYHLIWAGYLFASVLLILNIASLYSIFTKKKWGVNFLYLFFLLNVFETLFIMILTFLDFDIAKNAYMQSRVNRGLSTKNIDAIVNPTMTIVMILAYVGFYSLLTFYIHKKKDYFTAR